MTAVKKNKETKENRRNKENICSEKKDIQGDKKGEQYEERSIGEKSAKKNLKDNQNAGRTKIDTKKLQKENQELLTHLQRIQAEFENYQKRVQKEKAEIVNYAKEEILLKILEVIDNFERAIKAIENTEDIGQLKQGINMIFRQLEKTVKEEGVEAIESMGKQFNPYEHEAIAKEENEAPENTIIEVLQKGYKLNGKTIRPSKVKISGGKTINGGK